MKKKNLYALCFLLLAANPAFAQKEANNWHFGYGGGLTWNTLQNNVSATVLTASGTGGAATLNGLPTPVSGSSINTLEGCYSLSDKDGNLLFYSDGMTVWDRTHAVMPNGTGMSGHMSSAQSGIILPHPGSRTKYIAVTLGMREADPSQGIPGDYLAYSIIDMNENTNGGYPNGAVETATKNTRFTGYTNLVGEDVSAIAHANGRDYWIVAPSHSGDPTYINAWLVTPDGIQHTAPKISTVPGLLVNMQGCSGYFKFTPDGRHFVWATWKEAVPKLIFGSFDNSTGLASNVRVLEYPHVGTYTASNAGPYGVDFSPSGRYLYVTVVDIITLPGQARTSALHVYDFEALVAASDPSAVSRKEYLVSNWNSDPDPSRWSGSAIQLGPDGRLYMTNDGDYDDGVETGSRTIIVIDNPEEADNLNIYGLVNYLPAGNAMALGLPSFTASWWNITVDKELPVCPLEPLTFSTAINLGGSVGLSSIRWDFGDGTYADDLNVNQGTFSQTHSYSVAGTYTVSVTPYEGNQPITARTRTLQISVNPCAMPVNPNIHFISPSGGNED